MKLFCVVCSCMLALVACSGNDGSVLGSGDTTNESVTPPKFTLVEGDMVMPESGEQSHTLARVIRQDTKPWSKMTIPYCFANAGPLQDGNGTTINAIAWDQNWLNAANLAIKTWNATQKVNFKYQSTCPTTYKTTVGAEVVRIFRYTQSSYPALGYANTGYWPSWNTYVGISDGIGNPSIYYSISSVILHELGHTIGYTHEFASPNGTPYVSTQESIDPNASASPFDWGSIMMYDYNNGFSSKLPLTNTDGMGWMPLYTINDNLGLNAFSTKTAWSSNPTTQSWKLKSRASQKYLNFSGQNLVTSTTAMNWTYKVPLNNITTTNNVVEVKAYAGQIYPTVMGSATYLQNGTTLGIATSNSRAWMIDFYYGVNGNTGFVLWNSNDNSCIASNSSGSVYKAAKTFSMVPSDCIWDILS